MMTAREFFALPEPTGGFVWELHLGELVQIAIPVKRIYNLQGLIRELIAKRLARERWLVDIEMPYGFAKDYDYRRADVGVCLRKDFEAVSDDDYLTASPPIVVHVKKREEDPVLHLTHGASAVWLVKPELRETVVFTPTSRQVYVVGQSIPLPDSASLDVSEIFPL